MPAVPRTGTTSSPTGASAATSRAPGATSAPRPDRSPSASSGSRSIPASGRRRSTWRAPRRRSSSSSAARASRSTGTARRRAAHEIRAGDCIVYLALEVAHTLRAGPDGLDVLAFGMRTYADAATYLPRAGVSWLGASWVVSGGEENHPWTREAAAGEPEVGELAERPSTIVNVDEVEPRGLRHGDRGGIAPRSRPGGRVASHRHPADDGAPGQVRGGAARPLGRGGALRRPRGRGHAAPRRRGASASRGRRRRAPGGHPRRARPAGGERRR